MDNRIITKTQELAKLNLKKERLERIANNIKEILNYFNILKKLDTSKYSTSYNASGLKNILAEDEPDESIILSQEQATSNAPEKRNGYIVVPMVVKS